MNSIMVYIRSHVTDAAQVLVIPLKFMAMPLILVVKLVDKLQQVAHTISCSR